MNNAQIKPIISEAACLMMKQLETLENLDTSQSDFENQIQKAETTAYAAWNLIEQIKPKANKNESTFNEQIEIMKLKAANSSIEQIRILENLDASINDFDNQERKAKKITEIACNIINLINKL